MPACQVWQFGALGGLGAVSLGLAQRMPRLQDHQILGPPPALKGTAMDVVGVEKLG